VLRTHPEVTARGALAVLDGEKGNEKKTFIVSMSQAAEDQLVELGMTATQGLARCAGLALFYREAEEEERLQTDLLKLAAKWSPYFENTAPGICTIDLVGRPEAHRTPEPLCRQLLDALRSAGLEARVGMAGNPDLAFIAARLTSSTSPTCVLPTESKALQKHLSEVAIAALRPSVALLEVLDLWGVRRLGDLAKLDRTAIGERLGQEAVQLHDLCFGKGTRLLQLVIPPRDYGAKIEIDYEIQELEPLLFILRRLLESVCARLTSIYLVAGAIDLTLFFSDKTTNARHFRVPEPSADPEILFEILHTWLETFSADAPICGLEIQAHPTRAHGQQRRLFEASIRNPARFAQTLAQLEALFGTPSIGTPRPQNTYRPDAFKLNSYSLDIEPASSARVREDTLPVEVARPQTPLHPHGLPLRRFRPPQRIEVLTEAADAPHLQAPTAILTGSVPGTIADSQGPWAISGDWWDKECWNRLEWDIRHENSETIYRLYRDRAGWFLEGIYG
jgi:protein ImuB